MELAPIVLCMMTMALAWRPEIADERQFQLTPYLWLAGLKGEIGNGVAEAQPPRVDASLDCMFIGSLEARKGPWSILGHIVYLSVSKDAPIKLATRQP
jgi:hypothetical protein